MKKALYTIGIASMLTLALSGCSGRTGGKEAFDNFDTTDTAVAVDSLASEEAAEDSLLKFSDLASLREYIAASDDRQAYNEGIIPRIAEYSLDYATRLLNNRHPRFIIVDKGRMKVILYDRFGREEKTYGMGCAKRFGTKHKKADSRTPEGFFSVSGYYDSTDWLYRDDNGVESKKKGQFGPRFIRLRIPGTSQIGIHGTCAPWSIGGRVSHGCIRILNENILELVELVEKDMPVIVVPGRRDMIQNLKEGSETVWVPSTLTAKNPLTDDEKPRILEEEAEKRRQEEAAAMADSMSNLLPDSGDLQQDNVPTPTDSVAVQ